MKKLRSGNYAEGNVIEKPIIHRDEIPMSEGVRKLINDIYTEYWNDWPSLEFKDFFKE